MISGPMPSPGAMVMGILVLMGLGIGAGSYWVIRVGTGGWLLNNEHRSDLGAQARQIQAFPENESMKLTAAYKKVGEVRAASIEEIPGVHTQGATFEEARENLRDALSMILEVNRELAQNENEATRREEFVVA